MPRLVPSEAIVTRLIKDVNDIRSALRRVVATLPLYDIANENTPSQITSDQNDYVPGNYDILRLSTDAERTITGLTGGVKGRFIQLFNVGSYPIILAHVSGSSSAGNRFRFAAEVNNVLMPGSSMKLYYDITQGNWIEGTQLEESGIAKEYTPNQITANQNNYDPSDFGVLRLSSDAERTITGFAGGVQGRYLHLFNVGSNPIILSHESASSLAANRFHFSNSVSAFVAPGANMLLYYDATQARWVGGADRGANAIMDQDYVTFTPDQTFAGNWADITGATITLDLPVRCTIDVDAIVTGYNTLAGAGRGFYIRAVVDGTADSAAVMPYNGSENPARNQTLAYKYRATGINAGSRIVKLQCQADSGVNEPNYVTLGRLWARAYAEG